MTKKAPLPARARFQSSNAFVFLALLFLGTAVVHSQTVLGPVVKWDPAGIVLTKDVIYEGETLGISATIVILKDVSGLSFRAGVDTQEIHWQNFPGMLYAGTSLPIKFDWKAVKGRHNIFFRLVPPNASRIGTLKMNKTIIVLPSMQNPAQIPNLTTTNFALKDPCESYNHVTPYLDLVSCSVVGRPSSLAAPAILVLIVRNRNERCLENIRWNLYDNGSNGRLIERGVITPNDLDKEKYAIRGLETISYQIEHYRHFGMGNRTVINGQEMVQYKLRMSIVYGGPDTIVTIAWPLPTEEN